MNEAYEGVIQFNSIQFISTIPNACTTKISQFMKYSYVRKSPWYNTKIKCTGCQIYKQTASKNIYIVQFYTILSRILVSQSFRLLHSFYGNFNILEGQIYDTWWHKTD
jgi:hypothetical protein